MPPATPPDAPPPTDGAIDRLPSIAIVRDTVRRSKRAVLVALVFTALIVGAIVAERAVFLDRSERMAERIATAERVAGQLLLADEQLTNAATMAAQTGDGTWVTRYERYIADIDQAIAAAIGLASPALATSFHDATKVANDRLVDMERQAFAAIARQDLAAAQAVLASEGYQRDKRILADGTSAFAGAMLADAKADLRHLQRLADAFLVALLLVVAGASAWLWRRLSTDLDTSHQYFVRAQRAASSDALTGVANRVSMQDALSVEMAAARRDRTQLAVLMIDLDRFKPVNDSHGHPVGDAVLRIVAERIAGSLRPGALTARYGGDEFAVVIPDAPDADAIEQIGLRIIRSVSAPIPHDGQTLHVGACVGAAIFPRDAGTEDDLVRLADRALSEAKRTGKGRVVFYHPGLLDAETAHRQQVDELRQAIAAGQIVPYVQPVVRLSDGAVTSAEILSRWHHPVRGVVPPVQFIDLAEQAGEISAMTLSVLRQACLAAAHLPPSVRLAINATAPQIEDAGLADELVTVLQDTGFPRARLEVELTENALVRDIDAARRTIAALRAQDLSVALDDFGTGYSSLAYLSELSFDRIKIDRSFVRSMSQRPDSAKVVSAIVGLARNLGAQVTAEGVETPEEAQALAALGCESAQGYLYARPMPISEFAAWLAARQEPASAGGRRLRLV